MNQATDILRLGAHVEGADTRFRLWAPVATEVELVCDDRAYPMRAGDDGVFEHLVAGVGAGARYGYRLDGGPLFPDPASRYQPDGVHDRSQVIDPAAYQWRDHAWAGLATRELVLYELHVGTFTPEGSFEGVRDRLPYLRELGVTAIELMPLADFPGARNWGYDPAAFWAPARAYGHPDDLRALVDDAHQLGLAVFLDVVYNHLGPDGAYVAAYGPMFTPAHQTPWGQAINLDGDGSAGVRAFFLENALHWLREYHLDGLRLDATFALIDDSPTHFLAELSDAAHALPGPRRRLIAEDHPASLDPLVCPRERGGHGLDGVWADDFHHIVRRCVTGDEHGYFGGYPNTTAALAETIARGWYPHGPHAGPRRGSERDPEWARPEQFVFCIQNHDQVGNRAQGDRLSDGIDLARYRALTALLLFCPQTPLLFMGQEWAATTPFQYFTDHEPELGEKVRAGRQREFAAFPDFAGDPPDPQAAATFERSRLDWAERNRMPHLGIRLLYRDLLNRRRDFFEPEFMGPEVDDPNVIIPVQTYCPVEGSLVLRRGPCWLVVALLPNLPIPMPPNTAVAWHTELSAYTDTPRFPRIEHTDDGQSLLVQPVPGAIILNEKRT
ncbi:malto-oligosyltrehalose trehalohydrolase [Haliangium sp.]|uniref:malto-oligosyltrehalose trehalohydrolase n=1 Tax=Haliangium sp. TaxID=2663208 RepID=UPI003D141FD5